MEIHWFNAGISRVVIVFFMLVATTQVKKALFLKQTFSYSNFFPIFFADVLLVTWCAWMEPKRHVCTRCAPRDPVTAGPAWLSRPPNSPATVRTATEGATARPRWLFTGKTWAWASAPSLPSASASWPYWVFMQYFLHNCNDTFNLLLPSFHMNVCFFPTSSHTFLKEAALYICDWAVCRVSFLLK